MGEALAKGILRRLLVQEADAPGIEIQPLMDFCAKVKPNDRPDMDTVLEIFQATWPDAVEVTGRSLRKLCPDLNFARDL